MSFAQYADVGVRVFSVQDYANTYQLDTNTTSPTPYNKILRGGSWGFFHLHPVDWGKRNSFTLKPIWYSNYDNGVYWPIFVIEIRSQAQSPSFQVLEVTKSTDTFSFTVYDGQSYLIFNGAPTGAR